MTRFKAYKSKNAPTSRERAVFKEPDTVVEKLAWLVLKGRISEEQAADCINTHDLTSFTEYCIKYEIGAIF